MGDRVQDQVGQTGIVQKVEKKAEVIEYGCDSITAEPTTSSPTVDPDLGSTVVEPAESPNNMVEETPAVIVAAAPSYRCWRTGKLGYKVTDQQPEWEGRVWLTWEGKLAPEPVRVETLLQVGQQVFKPATGKVGKILSLSENTAQVYWDNVGPMTTAYCNISPFMREQKKEEDYLNFTQTETEYEYEEYLDNIDRVRNAIVDALESWQFAPMAETKLEETIIAVYKDCVNLGEIQIFPEDEIAKKYPGTCPLGGVGLGYVWAIDNDLLPILPQELVNTLEDLTFDASKTWQLVDIPIDDVNFRHYVGEKLVMSGICSDYTMDESSFEIFVPADSDSTKVRTMLNNLLEEVNEFQRDIPAKGSDRIPEPELFPPDWGIAG